MKLMETAVHTKQMRVLSLPHLIAKQHTKSNPHIEIILGNYFVI